MDILLLQYFPMYGNNSYALKGSKHLTTIATNTVLTASKYHHPCYVLVKRDVLV